MTTRFPSGLWAVVLIASILVNGLVLGALAAGAAAGLRVGGGGDDMGFGPPPSIRMIEDRLPPEARREVLEAMRREARQSRPLLAEARAANAAAMAALAAEDFDSEAVNEAFARARRSREALEARAHDMTVTLFSRLTYETRQELIERSRRGGDRRGGFGDGRMGPGDGRPGPGGPGGPDGGFPPPPPGD